MNKLPDSWGLWRRRDDHNIMIFVCQGISNLVWFKVHINGQLDLKPYPMSYLDSTREWEKAGFLEVGRSGQGYFVTNTGEP